MFFQGDDSVLEAKNSKSALLNPEAVSTKLQNEIEKGRVAGPFSEKPFGDKFKSSPLAIREKQVPGHYSLLHNLSYPYDKTSVNFNIPKRNILCTIPLLLRQLQ